MESSWPADIESEGERERGIEVDFEILNLIASLRFLALRCRWVGLPLVELGNVREGMENRKLLGARGFQRQNHLAFEMLASSWPSLSPECSSSEAP